MNIQDKLIEIHGKYGTSEMANYEIQKLFDGYYNQALEDLEGVEIINPKLVNDGFGEFPDVYELTGANVLQIKDKLKK